MIEKTFQEAFTKEWEKIYIKDPTNKLIIIRQIIPWQKIIDKLIIFYHPKKGKKGISLRITIAVLLLQKLRQLSDRKIVEAVKENRYMQYFCNVSDEKLCSFIEPGTISDFRKRIGIKGCEIIENEVFNVLKRADVVDKDTSLIDSTVLNSNIIYPNDVQLIFKAFKKMKNIAKKNKISFWWDDKHLRKRWRDFGLDKNASLVKYLEEFYNLFMPALNKFQEYCSNIKDAVNIIPLLNLLSGQTKLKLAGEEHIQNRIVSLDDIDARPIKKGKKHPKCEFGSTTQMTFTRLGFMVTTENFIGNPGDTTLYATTIQLFVKRMGTYPDTVVTDKGFRSSANFKNTPKEIQNVFLGSSSDVVEEKQDYCRKARSATEGFIAVAKNLRGFRKSLYHGSDGHRIWTLLCQAAYNLKKFLQLYHQEKIPEQSLIKLGLLA